MSGFGWYTPKDGVRRSHAELYGKEESSPRSGPLVGYRVLDFTQNQNGPMASSLLCDYGAEVIKIEPPGVGDPIRISVYPGHTDGFSTQLYTFNRGKRSVQIDLRKKAAREVILRLVKAADVVLENFKVGTMERLGLGYDELKKHNPRLVYVSSSGFGQRGEWAGRGSYDVICQALSGAAVAQGGGPSHRPIRVGDWNESDTVSGIMASYAVLAAIIARDGARGSGTGQRVDSSQLGAMTTLMNLSLTNVLRHQDKGRKVVQRDDGGMSGWGWGPDLSDYMCGDQKWLAVGTATGRFWRDFCAVLGRPDLATQHYRVQVLLPPAERVKRIDYKRVEAEVKRELLKWKRDDLVARLVAAGIPAAPHNSHAELVADPQPWDNGYLQRHDGVRHVGVAAQFSATPARVQGPPPQLGQHTAAVLGGAGFSPEEIGRLKADGVVFEMSPHAKM